MKDGKRILLSGDEAIALAALDAGVALGTGYPGTPSTEILEHFSKIGGHAQWAPNEKVALEVAIGVAYANARALVTMKHVGLNVAADGFFTVAYTGVNGGLVLVSADDPGMASSQNEQDNRRYAVAAGVPMLEPSDSQEAYEFTLRAFEISERWQIPVLLRVTTRVCHSKPLSAPSPFFEHNRKGRVMIPSNARPAHRRLRAKLAEIAAFSESSDLNFETTPGANTDLGIVTSGISYQHSLEAAPDAGMLKLGLSYPLPIEKIRAFAARYKKCVVVEEGDPYIQDTLLAAGIKVVPRDEEFRFGELNVARVRCLLSGKDYTSPATPPGKPPALCTGCPHREVFSLLRDWDCIVSGDIGCYSLGVLPPFEAMDTCVCMGASIGTGLGLRHALPEKEAKRVVSVIGDSTFLHSGLTGIVEMVYNPPSTGHVVLILDNGTTAMTGLQEHPGTGRLLNGAPAAKVLPEDIVRAMGVELVGVCDPSADKEGFARHLRAYLDSGKLAVLIARHPCILSLAKQKKTSTGNTNG